MTVDKKLFISGIEEKYDKRLLEGRITQEGNLIACFVKDITLMDDCKLSKNDFLSKDGRFYFQLLNALRNKNFNHIDEVTILTNFNDKVIDSFNDKGGYEVLQNLSEIVSADNFDAYLEQLIKSNLLNKLYLDGFNLFGELHVKDKKVSPFELFKNMTSKQIIDFYDMRLAGYETGENSEILEEDNISFDESFIEDLEDGEDLGIPYSECGRDVNGDVITGFKKLSNQTMGIHKGYLTMMAGFSSVGKSTIMITFIMALIEQGEKVIIISNEEDIKRFKIKFLCWLLAKYNRYYKLPKQKLTSGELSNEDKKQLKIAMEHYNKCYKDKIRFIGIATNDIGLIKKKIRDLHLRYGFSTFLIDTFKLSEDSMSGERSDLALVRDSRELHNLCKKYNLIGLITAQCGERFKSNLFMTAAVLSQSKQTKEILNQLFLMRSVYSEELDPNSKYYCNPFRLVKENGNWIPEEYIPDPKGVYVMLFVEKNRDGMDTSSDGISYIFKFNGAFSTFEEVCLCKCKHALIQ